MRIFSLLIFCCNICVVLNFLIVWLLLIFFVSIFLIFLISFILIVSVSFVFNDKFLINDIRCLEVFIMFIVVGFVFVRYSNFFVIKFFSFFVELNDFGKIFIIKFSELIIVIVGVL